VSRWFEQQAKQLFFRSLSGLRGGFLEIVCPDETYSFGDPAAGLRAMAVIHDERFFLRAITGRDIGIGESYMDGDWTSPDLVRLVRLCVRNLRSLDSRHKFLAAIRTLASLARHWLRPNTVAGSRENIRAHYDLGNEFYRLFLDERMMYSSGYYRTAEDSLDQAQTQKLELICRKLEIEPGDRVLEIGCGWGGLATYAARNYGALVTGVTISRAQYTAATKRLAQSDVTPGRARFLLEDYRKLSGEFDKIVSIEMFEAVGFAHYDEYFGACDRLLAPDGMMLLQTITLLEQEVRLYRKRVDWIQTYIFPGSELASMAEIQRSLARCTQLFVAHTETFGLHYAKTLQAWRQRFFEQLGDVRRLGFDDCFQRMWDFYLAWCEGAFRERYINVAQLVLAKLGTQRRLMGDPAGMDSSIRSDSVSL
jgi:cyclopropane-fatty-acyl-phospholipid synthase